MSKEKLIKIPPNKLKELRKHKRFSVLIPTISAIPYPVNSTLSIKHDGGNIPVVVDAIQKTDDKDVCSLFFSVV